MTTAIHNRRAQGHHSPMDTEHEPVCEHAIEYGNGRTSHCRCGADIPSNAAAIVKHLDPLTPDEWKQLADADPEADQ